jgi:shikimate kinase
MPASGKSYLANLLAEDLALTAIDLDRAIVAHYGQDIPLIFKQYGEEGFRTRERERLHALFGQTHVVVATGGGTPCFYDNIDQMNANGLTIWLQADLNTLAHRIWEDGIAHRPLFQSHLSIESLLEALQKMEEKRLPFYQKAALCIDSSLDRTQIVRFITSSL